VVRDLVEGDGIEAHELEVISERLEGFVDPYVGLVVHSAEVHGVPDDLVVGLGDLQRDGLAKDLSHICIIESIEHTRGDMSATVRTQIFVSLQREGKEGEGAGKG
jgi:hypothetical protein